MRNYIKQELVRCWQRSGCRIEGERCSYYIHKNVSIESHVQHSTLKNHALSNLHHYCFYVYDNNHYDYFSSPANSLSKSSNCLPKFFLFSPFLMKSNRKYFDEFRSKSIMHNFKETALFTSNSKIYLRDSLQETKIVLESEH